MPFITVAVAQYSNFACEGIVYLKIWLYNNLYMFTHLTMIFELTNQLNRFKELTYANSRSSANRYSKSQKCMVKQIF